MTKKNVVEMMVNSNAKMNEETKHYEMSQNAFDALIENLPDELKIVKSKNQENMYCVASKDGKSRYVIVDIVKTKKAAITKTKTTKKANDETGKAGHKAKGNHYIILLKKKDEKKETQITDIDNCADIKKFLKTVSKKQLEYLKIYDANKNEVRKSAWVG